MPPKPWRIRFLDGTFDDPEVIHRSYGLRDGAMAAAGELAYRFHRTVVVRNVDTGEQIRVTRYGQLSGAVR